MAGWIDTYRLIEYKTIGEIDREIDQYIDSKPDGDLGR